MQINKLLSLLISVSLIAVQASVTTAMNEKTFFQLHCVDCHGHDNPAGGLTLDPITAELDDVAMMATWTRIYDRVANHEMPPPEDAQPTDLQRESFLKPLQMRLHAASLVKQQQEGRVRIRRLNRAEYQHTLHDLLGVTTDVKSLLPEDSIVGGFDKIGAGLETSATHLVRFQHAVDRALADALPAEMIHNEPLRVRWTGREFFDNRPKPNRESTAPYVRFEGNTIILCATLYKHGSIQTAHTPSPGRYRIRASVKAIRSEGQPIPVLIGRISSDRFAHEKLEHILDIQDAPADQSRIIEVVANLPRGEHIYLEGLGLTFFNTLKEELGGNPIADDYQGPGLAVDWIELEGPLDTGVGYRQWFGGLPRVPNRFYADAMAGKDIKENWRQWHPNEFSKSHNRLRLLSNNPTADAERLIRAFIPRAFRRSVSDELLDTFVQPARRRIEQGEPLEDVLFDTYKSVLCSPHFFLLVEQPGELDDFALASRLSYFLWDSMPDEELMDIASRGELKQPAALSAQTDRLLKHPKAARFVESFTGQWLDLRKIHEMKPDAMYVEYDDLLAWSMPEETRQFFAHVLRHDLPTSSFVNSDWTMLNQRLARHYGLPAIAGLELRPVSLPSDSHRGGVITQASVLKLSTNATYTSPVKRGVWLLERMLGTPPSPPPPDVAAVEPDIRGAVTIREQLAKHQAVAACGACHRQIDPPGFALENFDVIGGWREFYRSPNGGDGKQYVELTNYPGKKVWQSLPVEASGELASGEHFANIDSYRQLVLRDHRQLTRNLAEKLMIYATGSPLQFADREVIEEIVMQADTRNHGFRSLLHQVIQSRVFRSK